MFNSVSRAACRTALAQHPKLRTLLTLFDTLYDRPNTCWYLDPTRNWKHFPQQEGFAQGCPLSGAFAALVLHQLLTNLHTELQARHDSPETTPNSMSYHDDTSIALPYPDLPWYIN